MAQNRPGPLPPQPPQSSKRRWLPWVVVGVLVLVLAAVATVFLLNRNTGNTTHTTSYQTKLTAIMTPIVNDNLALSKALQAIDGSGSTLKAAGDSNATTQQAVVAARGALAVLTVSASQQQLNQQATQALTQEAGYLQAIDSTLADPNSSAAGSLQSLASATNAAFVPLASVAPAGSTSIYGVDNLLGWVAGAQGQAQEAHDAQQAAKQTAASQAANQAASQAATQAASSSPEPTPNTVGLTACDQNISVNGQTSCGFADNAFNQYAIDVQANGAGSYSVIATSPTTGDTYTDYCSDSAGQVSCSHGSDLIVFPEWAAAVYRTH